MRKLTSLILIILAALLFVIGCGKTSNDGNSGNGKGIITNPEGSSKDNADSPGSGTAVPSPTADPLMDTVKSMTTDEKIGQMVISGIDGYTLMDTTSKMIKDYHVGGFIILGENVKNSEQLLSLVNSLKTTNSKSSKLPLFLSIDQEGGRVDRMPSEIKRLPLNSTIGKVTSSSFSYEIGSILAEELNLFGLNMDFAPVLDINSNPQNPVIGDRSYGSKPDVVVKHGIQTMLGIKSGSIIPVVKHFPGHGDTSTDSHVGLPAVNNDIERLKSFELIPFNEAIKGGADAVMVAHILLPKIDPKNPSSMSKIIVDDILRKGMNYDGVVITDDMTMGAIMKNYDIKEAAVKSVNAGCDIILVCHGYDNETAVINALKSAVQNGTITEERINQSVLRILALKSKYKLGDKIINSVDIDSINSRIDSTVKKYIQ